MWCFGAAGGAPGLSWHCCSLQPWILRGSVLSSKSRHKAAPNRRLGAARCKQCPLLYEMQLIFVKIIIDYAFIIMEDLIFARSHSPQKVTLRARNSHSQLFASRCRGVF